MELQDLSESMNDLEEYYKMEESKAAGKERLDEILEIEEQKKD